MKRLNYTDLLYMIVNYDIIKLEEYYRQKKATNNKDYEVVDATPEMASKFFKH